MTEEQIFKNLFPEYRVGEKCLSPYFDLFQIGFEEGEKQNKKLQEENDKLKKEKIPQLERKIASIRGAHSVDCKKLNARLEQVERLKKENNEFRTKMENMVTEIDKFMCLKSTLREGEIYDIQEFFRKYGFYYDHNSQSQKLQRI